MEEQTQTFSHGGRKSSSFLWSSMFVSRELKINRGGVCLCGDILPKNELLSARIHFCENTVKQFQQHLLDLRLVGRHTG